jgi:quercetin dioxygenase-like cupin family protein
MKVISAAQRATKVAPAASFTGMVLQDEVVTGAAPSRLRALRVSFTPGARTAWHTHPVGQTLYVLSGVGRVQEEGKEPIELHPGDTVEIPPDVKHWHGADSQHLFVHLAISEVNDAGEGTRWLEHVTDEQHAARATRLG